MKKTLELLWISFLQAIKGAIWKWLVGSASTLFGLLLFAKNFLEKSVANSFKYGIIFVLVIFVSRLILFFSINVVKHLHFVYKESIYGDAIIILRDSFSKVHYLRKKGKIDDEEFMEVMVVFCNNLKKIFDKKTKKQCSVSIKVPVKGPVNSSATVHNLCRDSIATKTRDTDDYKRTNHTIIGNTAFQKIVNNIFKGNKENFFYLNNDINSAKDYENTSKDAYPENKLPYVSELVCPIIPHTWEKGTSSYECIGFICVDCEDKDVFDNKYDVAIMSGVADGIYDLITFRNSSKENI